MKWIDVSDEIGDSSVDCQRYVAFVIEVVGTLGLSRPIPVLAQSRHADPPA
jgi:hypothetical protein